jgi:NTP pyrophosphatase (non-canonical NTP hydrolase)
MITQEDIDAFSIVNVTPMEYSYFVESMIVTKPEDRLMENLLGLCEEVGELQGKIKRKLRDGTFNRDDILKELGDVQYYTTSIANYFDSNLQEIMEINMDKLNSRAKRGVIKGSGDNR